MHAFQMQYLSIETACEREQRQERSISVMMCEKGKLLAQHVLFLITFHLAIFHLMQNKQLEMQCDDIQPSAAAEEPAFSTSGHICKHTLPTESFSCTCMIEGYYNVFKVSPSGHFVQAETWWTHQQHFCLRRGPSRAHSTPWGALLVA